LSSYRVSAKGLVQLQGVSSGACPATGCPTEGLLQLQGGCPTEGLTSYKLSH